MKGWAPFLALLLAGSPVFAAGTYCPLAGQTPMLSARLFLGENIAGRGPLTEAEWNSFLAQSVTPLFPSGFTVYDASGQWQPPGGRTIAKENTKVIEIDAQDSPALRRNLDAIAAAYKKQFNQQSVGIVTADSCARF